MKKIFSLCMVLIIVLGCVCTAYADNVANSTIDNSRKGSMTIYKYDLTNAEKDGVWDSSYVSTGIYDQDGVVDILGGAVREGDTDAESELGNGNTSYGYAIKGVEFSYLKIADVIQFSESSADSRTDGHIEILYAINKVQGAGFLKALGLENGAHRYLNADGLDPTAYYYQSDVLIKALATGLEANSTTVKNALENYIGANGGVTMAPTDAYGKTGANNLELGLYLIVETSVPEMVVSTTDPFLVSVPMTSVDGSNASDGGTRWIYDITLFPKNLTGIPSLEKTLRENADDTGKNYGSTASITDGYAHTATASAGDVIDYQIISTLPSITSESTYLTCYTFIDTLSSGLSYKKGDVVLEFFTNDRCSDLVTTWREVDGYFTTRYNSTSGGGTVMTIEMTDRGLAMINASKSVYTGASMVNSGYSDCTLRITYQAQVDSDNTVVYGDTGNPNEVVLTWKRSNTSYYDTLIDDAHVYTYGIDLTKLFSDGAGNFENVEFIVHNDTDDYFIKAELNTVEGVYYVTDHEAEEADATHFIPVKSGDSEGKVIIKGLEDDTYTITEVRTDNGYTLLKENIEVIISQKETTELCDVYEDDVLGLIQNDPHYAEIIKDTGDLKNMPQKHLEHHLLTASATVDSNRVNMRKDKDSENALAPLSVVNTKGFDLPATGDHGTWFYSVFGIMAMAAALGGIIFIVRKKEAKK